LFSLLLSFIFLSSVFDRRHAGDFVRTRLADANPPNDGRQTPMRGHPVFKAQHACACCCRSCLEKWWRVPRGTPIPASRQRGIVDFLLAWIERERSRAKASVTCKGDGSARTP